VASGAIGLALGEALRYWRIALAATPDFFGLLYLGLAISCTPIYPINWRCRGLTVSLIVEAVIGPPRD
jgi:hypothetical protein